MEIVHKAIKCANCSSVLESPVILPCGHSICKKHAAGGNDESIRCGICGEDHVTPSNGFPENIALGEILKSKIESLDFGDVYKNAKKYCDNLAELHQEIDDLLKNPAHFTHEQISEVRNEIQIKGEEIKLQVDREMDRLFEKLNQVETDLKSYFSSDEYSVKSKCLESTLKESQSKLDSWISTLNRMTIDETKWKSINDEGHETYSFIESELVKFKYEILFKYDLIYRELKHFLDINVDAICQFNYLDIDSEIIKYKQRQELGEMLKFPIESKWSLLYRATRDGFKASDFHEKCDGKANTLTIIKSSSGNIFGGYTTCEWDQSSTNKKGSSDFIFSFRNKFYQRMKMNKLSPEHGSIYCSAKFGPIFGDCKKGYDFMIVNCSNQSEACYSNLGSSFLHPFYKYGSSEAQIFLAGSQYFKVDEIEVYQYSSLNGNGHPVIKRMKKSLSFVNPMYKESFNDSAPSVVNPNEPSASPLITVPSSSFSASLAKNECD